MSTVESEVATTTEEIWVKLKTGLMKTTEEVYGISSRSKLFVLIYRYSKTCVKQLLSKKQKIVFQDQLSQA